MDTARGSQEQTLPGRGTHRWPAKSIDRPRTHADDRAGNMPRRRSQRLPERPGGRHGHRNKRPAQEARPGRPLALTVAVMSIGALAVAEEWSDASTGATVTASCTCRTRRSRSSVRGAGSRGRQALADWLTRAGFSARPLRWFCGDKRQCRRRAERAVGGRSHRRKAGPLARGVPVRRRRRRRRELPAARPARHGLDGGRPQRAGRGPRASGRLRPSRPPRVSSSGRPRPCTTPSRVTFMVTLIERIGDSVLRSCEAVPVLARRPLSRPQAPCGPTPPAGVQIAAEWGVSRPRPARLRSGDGQRTRRDDDRRRR